MALDVIDGLRVCGYLETAAMLRSGRLDKVIDTCQAILPYAGYQVPPYQAQLNHSCLTNAVNYCRARKTAKRQEIRANITISQLKANHG